MNMRKFLLLVVLIVGMVTNALSAGWFSYAQTHTLVGNETFLVGNTNNNTTNNEQITGIDLASFTANQPSITNNKYAVYDDTFNQVTTNMLSPLGTPDWQQSSVLPISSIHGGETYLDEAGRGFFGEELTLTVPGDATSVTFSDNVRSLSGTVNSVFIGLEYNNTWYGTGAPLTPTLTSSSWYNFSTVVSAANLVSSGTNLGAKIFWTTPGAISVSNLQVTVQGTTNGILSHPFKRYMVRAQNLLNDAGNQMFEQGNANPSGYENINQSRASNRSYLDFQTDANTLDFEVSTFATGAANSGQSVIVYLNGQPYATNVVQITPNFFHWIVTIGTNNIYNTVRFVSSQTVYSANGDYCRAIDIPATNHLKFVNSTPSKTLLLIGDSILTDNNQQDGVQTPSGLLANYFPIKVINYSAGSGGLYQIWHGISGVSPGVPTKTILAGIFASQHPDDIWFEHGINDLGYNYYGDGTNTFQNDLADLVDTAHAYCPWATIYLQNIMYNPAYDAGTGIGGGGYSIHQYRDAVKAVALSRTNYCIFVDASSWLTSADVNGGDEIHPTPSGNVKYVWNIANQLWTNRMVVSGISQKNLTGLPFLTNSLPTITDPLNAVKELDTLGQFKYLSDFALFENQYNTNTTYRSYPISIVNGTNTPAGLYLGTNSYVEFQCNVAVSNTVGFVFSFDTGTGVNMAQAGNVWQLVDTNSNSGEFTYVQNNPWVGTFLESNNIAWPNVMNLTNLVVDPWFSYGGWFTYQKSTRVVFVFTTDGNGNEKCYLDGKPMTYYNSGLSTLQPPLFSTNTMNRFRIGLPFYSSTVTRYGSPMTLESVWLFNKYADANLVQAIGYASDWTQLFTKRRFDIGDSLMAGNSTTNNLATMVDTAVGFNDAIIRPFYLGGTGISSYLIFTNSMYQYEQPHGKITECQINYAAGINDLYGGGVAGITEFQNFSNTFIIPTMSDTRWKINIYTVNQVFTNGTGPDAPQTPSLNGQRINYNRSLYSNKKLFNHIYNRDYRVTQNMLDPTRSPQLSTVGLHFDGTAGDSAYQMIAGDVISPERNPYILTNLPPELIVFPASTVGYTNFMNDTVQIVIDNSAATSPANLTKNGTVILASPGNSVEIILGPYDYFSETYSGTTPKGYQFWTH